MLALAICVCLVILQYQGYLRDEIGLKQVPVVVRHTIGNDVLRPFLETSLNDGLVILHERFDEGIHLGEFINDILVDNLKSSHAHQGLLMTMVQVDRHIAIGDALHIDIEHLCCHLSIAHIASGGINASGITGDGDNLTVHTCQIASRLGWRSLLHLACSPANVSNATLLIVIIRNNILQLRAIILRCRAS